MIFYSIDVWIYNLINSSYHNILFNNLALSLCYLGVIYTVVLIGMLFALFEDKKGKDILILLLMGMILSAIVIGLIKSSVLRPRPYEVMSNVVLLTTEVDSSFPSGHTVVSTCMSVILAKEYNKKYLLLIPLLVGFSRIYIGVHYPSDVFFGLILGVIIATITEYVFNKYVKVKIIKYFRKTLKD